MLMSATELLRFELRWKLVFFTFAVVFVIALLDRLLRSPHGWEAFWCYGLGGVGLFGCLYSARTLGDPDRLDATLDSLALIDEDIAVDLGDIGDQGQ